MSNLIESHKNRSLDNLQRQNTRVLEPKLQMLCGLVKRRPRVRNLLAGQPHGKNEIEQLSALMRKPADKIRQELDPRHNRHPLVHRSKELVGGRLDVGNISHKVRHLLCDEMVHGWLRDSELGAGEGLRIEEALGEKVGRGGRRRAEVEGMIVFRAWVRCLGCKGGLVREQAGGGRHDSVGRSRSSLSLSLLAAIRIVAHDPLSTAQFATDQYIYKNTFVLPATVTRTSRPHRRQPLHCGRARSHRLFESRHAKQANGAGVVARLSYRPSMMGGRIVASSGSRELMAADVRVTQQLEDGCGILRTDGELI